MKALITILTLILITAQNSKACKGFQEPEVKDVVASAQELSDFVSDDANFTSLKEMSSEDQKQTNLKQAMQPVDFSTKQHEIDAMAMGDLMVESNTSRGVETARGSAYKIGKSCIVTASHVLYGSADQEMSDTNRAKYNGKIKFVRAGDKKEMNASVFFQMTKKDDYKVIDGNRHFKGHSDIVILKLDNYSDNNYKKVKVTNSSELLKNVNPAIGKKITCMGSPSHMTEKNFGSCKGSDFQWKQENARIFKEDESKRNLGIITNAAFSPGMSGGACFLAENTNELIGIAVNGYMTNNQNELVMPDVEFSNGAYTSKNARHIATFHQLDQRMRNELGFGLDQLNNFCK